MDETRKPRPSPADGEQTTLDAPLIDADLHASAVRELLEPPTKGRILVVDTDAQQTVARQLESGGFSVVSTDDGVIATQLLASGWFDAIVADLGARALNGIELLRFARTEDPDLPVLLMTDAPDVESAAAAVDAGAFQYLLKPVLADRLIDAAMKAMQTRATALAKRDILESLLADQETDAGGLNEEQMRFESTIKRLWLAYQPIVRPTGKIYAYEALVRSDEPTARTPADILGLAENLGTLRELGRAVRRLAGEAAVKAAGSHHVFVNLHADDLLDDLLTAGAEPLSQVAPAVVLEITERAALVDVEEAKVKMAELRNMGFRVALDDLGAGYAGLTAFAQLRPDVVKLDMTLVRDVDKDPVRKKLVGLVTEVSRDIGAIVVGEGVETKEERDVLIELGCHLLQGFFFGKPQRVS